MDGATQRATDTERMTDRWRAPRSGVSSTETCEPIVAKLSLPLEAVVATASLRAPVSRRPVTA